MRFRDETGAGVYAVLRYGPAQRRICCWRITGEPAAAGKQPGTGSGFASGNRDRSVGRLRHEGRLSPSFETTNELMAD